MPRNGLIHPLTAALTDGGPSRERAIRSLRKALRDANGRIALAAESLGVNRMTMFRLVASADLSVEASEMREKANVPGSRRAPEPRKTASPKKA